MPLSTVHRRKRSKNFFALAVILLFIFGLFYLTTLKVANARPQAPAATQQ
jgi:hypothetical protein